MPLAPGHHLGNFEILAHIGAGGMGDVYKARDMRLNRTVAIKTSKAQFNDRFTREARAIAALNHPNIATLFDVGPDYLVMEFVEGEPLKGPIPHDAALKAARQIADAIEAAHDKAIIHRDLKPGNILQREDGSIKVLDFGLAKALENDEATTLPPGPDSPTLTLEATKVGMILGTAAYMSPEQAKGKRADRRADIFSFGVVLYELLTGKRLFTGESTGEVLAAVIMQEAKLDAVPENWRGLLKRCLEKDPRQRLQAIGEARLLLEQGMPMPAAPAPVIVEVAKPSRRAWLPWAVAALALAGAAFLYTRPRAAEPPEVTFQIQSPDETNIQIEKISPDGRSVAFITNDHLWVRSLNQLEPRMLADKPGNGTLFWSPDSSFVGYAASGKLMRVAAAGGSPQVIQERGGNGSWGTAGTIVFGTPTGLFRMPADGGTATEIYKNPNPLTTYQFPEFLPDGKHFLYFSNSNDAALNGVYVGTVDGSAPVKLLPDTSAAAFIQAGGAGYLLFQRQGALLSQSFDPAKLKLSGVASPLAENIGSTSSIGGPGFSASAEGSLAFQGNQNIKLQLAWLDRTGTKLVPIGDPAAIRTGRLSPDERLLALAIRLNFGNEDLWIQDLDRGTRTRLTSASYIISGEPVWSPSGNAIYFSPRNGPQSRDLVRKSLTTGAKEEVLWHAGSNGTILDVSFDEKNALFYQSDADGDHLYLLPLEGEHKPVPLHIKVSRASGNNMAAFSPDAKFVAYVSSETQRDEVYVEPVSVGSRVAVSSKGGSAPRWSRDGKQLYFTSPEGFMSVPVRLSPSLDIGQPSVVFTTASLREKQIRTVAPTRDPQRFLAAIAPEGLAPPLTVMLHWKPR